MTVSSTPGSPCWIELFTSDQDAATRFYGEVFGWTAGEADEDFGGYLMFFRDGAPVAGCMRNDASSGSPDTWTVYLESPDIEATARKATAAGGQVVVGPLQVADLGHMLAVVDPAGARVGAWQPLEFHGFAVRGEVSAPAWFETLSTSYAFYTDAFDWDARTMSDTAEFRYTTLGADESATAGIMDARAFLQDAPSVWQFYVEVADTDAAVEKAVAAGATTVSPADDTPYGRLALLEDPVGTRFAVMGPARSTV